MASLNPGDFVVTLNVKTTGACWLLKALVWPVSLFAAMHRLKCRILKQHMITQHITIKVEPLQEQGKAYYDGGVSVIEPPDEDIAEYLYGPEDGEPISGD